MNTKHLITAGAVVVVGAILLYAYKKSQPPQPAAGVSATPNQLSGTSELQTNYGLIAGISGVIPLISFPDISGSSANVTMNT